MVEPDKPWREPSQLESAMTVVPGIPIYLLFAEAFDQPFRGSVAGASVGLLLLLAFVLSPLRRRPAFWPAFASIAAVHVLLVALLPYTGRFSYGFAFFPAFFLDAYLSAKLIIRLCGFHPNA